MTSFSGMHGFDPTALIDTDADEQGTADDIIWGIEHGLCPRCEGPLPTMFPAGCRSRDRRGWRRAGAGAAAPRSPKAASKRPPPGPRGSRMVASSPGQELVQAVPGQRRAVGVQQARRQPLELCGVALAGEARLELELGDVERQEVRPRGVALGEVDALLDVRVQQAGAVARALQRLGGGADGVDAYRLAEVVAVLLVDLRDATRRPPPPFACA